MTVETFTSVIGQLLPEPHAGLLSGISFGARARLAPDLYDALIKTGTLHVVALSGMNISIVVRLVSGILLTWFSRRWTGLMTIVVIIGFIWFVGPSPSVVRAGIMGSLALFAVALGRNRWAIYSWFVATGTMLALNPLWIWDIGFQLSVMATLGIILFGGDGRAGGVSFKSGDYGVREGQIEQIKNQSGSVTDFFRDTLAVLQGVFSWRSFGEDLPPERKETLGSLSTANLQRSSKMATFASLFRIVWKLAQENLRVTLAAQVFTIPLIFLHFQRISLVSPLSNLLIGFLMGPLTVAGWVVAVAAFVFFPLGQALAWATWLALEYVIRVVFLTSQIPLASWGW